MIDNKDSKKRYRADVLVEDYAEKLLQKAEKEIAKAKKRFGEDFDAEMYKETNPRVKRYLGDRKEILERLARSLTNEDLGRCKSIDRRVGDRRSGYRF